MNRRPLGVKAARIRPSVSICMSTKNTPDHTPDHAATDASNTIKDPDTWTTGGEPATGAQMSYLKTLMGEAGQEFDESKEVTKTEASKMIEELRSKNARVQENE